MWPFDFAQTMLLVTSITSSLVSVIAALKAHNVTSSQKEVIGQQRNMTIQQGIIEGKLDIVHEQSNSRITEAERQLHEARLEVAMLQEFLQRSGVVRPKV